MKVDVNFKHGYFLRFTTSGNSQNVTYISKLKLKILTQGFIIDVIKWMCYPIPRVFFKGLKGIGADAWKSLIKNMGSGLQRPWLWVSSLILVCSSRQMTSSRLRGAVQKDIFIPFLIITLVICLMGHYCMNPLSGKASTL